jgi:hypothetical protein
VEEWQGDFPLGFGAGTSFAIEDYPSNYIGLLAAIKYTGPGEPTTYDSVRLILEYLGPVEWFPEAEPPPHSDNWPASICENQGETGCMIATEYYALQVKNYEFSPRIEIAPGNYANVAWPCDDLVIQPIGEGPDTWHWRRSEHNRNLRTVIEGGWNRYVKPWIDRITPW